MPLTGPQHRQIQDALLAAFDGAGLRRLVKFELDEDLDQVTPPGDLTQRAYHLVAWADKHGRIPALIAGALKQNSGNPDLQVLAEAAQAWHIEAAAEPEAQPPYQGLAFFDVTDADRFFGREKLTAELVTYLKEHRFLAVVGASGSGKSSVVILLDSLSVALRTMVVAYLRIGNRVGLAMHTGRERARLPRRACIPPT